MIWQLMALLFQHSLLLQLQICFNNTKDMFIFKGITVLQLKSSNLGKHLGVMKAMKAKQLPW